MAQKKNNLLPPAAYGLTAEEVQRVIRIHDMCKDMDEDSFEQMETIAWALNLVRMVEGHKPRPMSVL